MNLTWNETQQRVEELLAESRALDEPLLPLTAFGLDTADTTAPTEYTWPIAAVSMLPLFWPGVRWLIPIPFALLSLVWIAFMFWHPSALAFGLLDLPLFIVAAIVIAKAMRGLDRARPVVAQLQADCRTGHASLKVDPNRFWLW